MSRPNIATVITAVPFTVAERAAVIEAAKRNGLSARAWMRAVLADAAKHSIASGEIIHVDEHGVVYSRSTR